MDIHRILYIAGSGILVTLMLSSTIGMGSLAYRPKETPALERWFIQACLGIGIWSYSLVLCGLLWILNYQSVLVLLTVSLFGLWKLKQAGNLRAELDSYDKIFLLACLVSVAPIFLLSLYPPHSYDDTLYHLPTALSFAQSHSLDVPQYVRFPLFNEFMEVLYSACLCFNSDSAAQLLNTICYALCQLGIYSTISRYSDKKYALLAVTVFVSSAVAVKLASTTFVEIPTALMCLASAASILRFANSHDEAGSNMYLILAGVFAGFAMSCKYTAIPFVFGMVIALLLNKNESTNWTTIAKYISIFLLAAAICSAFWFGRNFLYTGNPTFPYLWKYFGQHYVWTISDYEWLNFCHEAFRRYPINPLGLIRALWTASFGVGLNEFSLGFCSMFLPGLVLAMYFGFRSNEYRRIIRLLFIPTVAFLIPWFFSSQNTRLLTVILPVVATYSTLAMKGFLEWFMKKANMKALEGTYAVFLLLGMAVGSCPVSIGRELMNIYGPIPVNSAERDKLLSRLFLGYPAYILVNSTVRGNLYSYGDEQMNYFYRNGTFMGDWFGVASYWTLEKELGSSKDLHNFLLSKNIKYLLVNRFEKTLPIKVISDDYFKVHFKQIFDNDSCVVYQLSD